MTARFFHSHCQRKPSVDKFEATDILLVEDSDADAEMILRALRKGSVVNRVVRVHDGVEALEFVFREGDFRERGGGQPRFILLDLKMAAPRRHRCSAPLEIGRAGQGDTDCDVDLFQ